MHTLITVVLQAPVLAVMTALRRLANPLLIYKLRIRVIIVIIQEAGVMFALTMLMCLAAVFPVMTVLSLQGKRQVTNRVEMRVMIVTLPVPGFPRRTDDSLK